MLARVSLTGKLRVDEAGVLVGVVVTEMKPFAVWPATVTLPVTAIASAGIVPPDDVNPATVNDLGVLALKMPVTPRLMRLSSTRSGAIGT